MSIDGKSKGWVVVVLEGEHKQFPGEIAYVKGPFDTFEAATDWADKEEDCADGEWQITFIEAPKK